MKVYVALINEPHSEEPEPYVFSTAAAAIDYARGEAHRCAYSPQDVVEHRICDWLYHATYSPEGDAVRVQEKEVDKP